MILTENKVYNQRSNLAKFEFSQCIFLLLFFYFFLLEKTYVFFLSLPFICHTFYRVGALVKKIQWQSIHSKNVYKRCYPISKGSWQTLSFPFIYPFLYLHYFCFERISSPEMLYTRLIEQRQLTSEKTFISLSQSCSLNCGWSSQEQRKATRKS